MDAPFLFESEPGFNVKAFQEILSTTPPVSIRKHLIKSKPEDHQGEPISWCPQGLWLADRPFFAHDPLFHAGAYYVQESSSMAIWSVIKKYIHEPVVALDACAAPGGKTTLLADALPSGSLLIANEVIAERNAILRENVEKWGNLSVAVIRNDPAHIGQSKIPFNLMVCDAPCSGSGMWRKDPETIKEWSHEHVSHCAARQKRIVADLWPALTKEGYFIYSTCSFSYEENESVVKWICNELGAELIPLTLAPAQSHEGCLRFYPWEVRGEGLFIALLQKKSGPEFHLPKTEKRKKQTDTFPSFHSSNNPTTWMPWLDETYLVSSPWQDYLWALGQKMKLLRPGVPAGKMIRHEWIPDPAMAYVPGIEHHFPSFNTELEDALQYLRKVYTPGSAISLGWHLVTYQSRGLGFLKSMGNRINNYFPPQRRLRT